MRTGSHAGSLLSSALPVSSVSSVCLVTSVYNAFSQTCSLPQVVHGVRRELSPRVVLLLPQFPRTHMYLPTNIDK